MGMDRVRLTRSLIGKEGACFANLNVGPLNSPILAHLDLTDYNGLCLWSKPEVRGTKTGCVWQIWALIDQNGPFLANWDPGPPTRTVSGPFVS